MGGEGGTIALEASSGLRIVGLSARLRGKSLDVRRQQSMANGFWQDLWTLLNTDVKELGLVSFESAGTAIEGTKSLIELAGTLDDKRKDLPELASVLAVAKPLIDVLDSPIASVVGGVLPFGSIGLGILKICLQRMEKDPTLSDCVMVVGQAAYLESFQEILSKLEEGELKQVIAPLKLKDLMKAQSERLKSLKESKPDNATAQQTLNCFHDSELARALGQALGKALEEQALQAQRSRP